MATINPFDLLGDDTEDPSIIAAQQPKIESKKAAAPPAPHPKLPSKPVPPAQAVRDAKSDFGRGTRGRGRGFSRGGGVGPNRDFANNSYGNKEVSAAQGAPDEIDGRSSERRGGYGGPRGSGSFHGGRRGGYSNGDAGEGDRDRRRPLERRSGTGRGTEMKRDGSGRGNWGAPADEFAQATDEVNEVEKDLNLEKPSGEEEVVVDGEKEATKEETEEKEAEDKEMTLEEYEKVLEEKRKALLALKSEATRKVDAKEFESMQQLADKKANDDVFIKLGSEKDKKKDLAEKEEKAKKSVSINEFLKPAEGERYYSPGGRGRGRGRGPRGGGGLAAGGERSNYRAPTIEDPAQFPILGGK